MSGGDPAAILAFAQSPIQGVILLGFWFVFQQLKSYVLIPAVLGKFQHVSPAVVLLSILAGFYPFGIVAALIAVPVVAATSLVVKAVVRPARESQIEAEDPQSHPAARRPAE